MLMRHGGSCSEASGPTCACTKTTVTTLLHTLGSIMLTLLKQACSEKTCLVGQPLAAVDASVMCCQMQMLILMLCGVLPGGVVWCVVIRNCCYPVLLCPMQLPSHTCWMLQVAHAVLSQVCDCKLPAGRKFRAHSPDILKSTSILYLGIVGTTL